MARSCALGMQQRISAEYNRVTVAKETARAISRHDRCNPCAETGGQKPCVPDYTRSSAGSCYVRSEPQR